jgi:hypothetical protein
VEQSKGTACLFNVLTPLGFKVRVTQTYWDLIATVKHPVMRGHESDVKATLEKPEEIRHSNSDASVYLFYKTQKVGRWVCAVTKKIDQEGFLITAYPSDSMKEGVKIWPK